MPKLRVTKINFVKKIALSFLASLIILLSFAPYLTVNAAPNPPASTPTPPVGTTTWYNQSFEDWFIKVYDDNTSPPNEIFGERYTAAQVQWVLYSLVAIPMVAGSDLSKKVIACALTKSIVDCADAVDEFINSLGQQSYNLNNSSWVLTLGQNPVSGIAYFRNLAQKLKVPEAKAQGFGYNTGANFSQFLWRISRNITYSLIVVAVIIFAFMIMFRVKMNPQTVITMQSAIPKVIIALILITFSYAIAGFAIDLVYVVIGIFSVFAVQNGLTTFDTTTLFTSLTTGKNAFTLLFQYWVLFLLGSMGHLFAGGIILGVIQFIFAIVSIVILLWSSIKIIFMLLKTFVMVQLSIITAPFQIFFGLFTPGGGFGTWFKSLLGHLAVYPVTGAMFFLAFLFLRQLFPDGSFWDKVFVFNTTSKIGADVWNPPLTVGTGTGVFGGIWILLAAMSFVIVTLIPKTVEIIQGFLSGRPFAYGSAIGEALGPAKTAGTYGAAEFLNARERIAKGDGATSTPAWIQTTRKALNLKP